MLSPVTLHEAVHDYSALTPVCPNEEVLVWVHQEATGLLQVGPDERSSAGAGKGRKTGHAPVWRTPKIRMAFITPQQC